MIDVEVFYSFRSPYSYLAGPRTFALEREYDARIDFRAVLPMAMRGQAVPREKFVHTMHDVRREAGRLGMRFGPVFDPIGERVLRVLALSELAKDRGVLEPFVLTAAETIWGRGGDIGRPRVMRRICERARLPWTVAEAAQHDPELRSRSRRHAAALEALGQWGVPVFRIGSEVLWGQDRLPDVEKLLRAL